MKLEPRPVLTQPCVCLRCGYLWRPKVQTPKECPACKSRYWDQQPPKVQVKVTK